jgi:hypothetical protein
MALVDSALALAGIFAIAGLNSGLHVVAGMAVGTAVGITLVLACRHLRHFINR